nr:immunoglobulin light chain junction region [Macaca mulatta]MOX14289.1 immunoglobulin light chain junction region [Macaca mulatta]
DYHCALYMGGGISFF